MIKNLYTVFDSVAGLCLSPMVFRNHAEATRALSTLVNEKDTQYAANPGDYVLMFIGTFDETNGALYAANEILCNARSLLKGQS